MCQAVRIKTVITAITSPTMTNVPIHDLNMTDTEYAALAIKGYEPILERQLIAIGENPDKARSLTRFVGLLQDKPPETEEEWQELMTMWEEVCRYKPKIDQRSRPNIPCSPKFWTS